jgi:putative ATP-binding cassette transporter
VVDNFLAIMKKQKQLTWFTSGYGQIAVIFPFLVAAPRYFSGGIALGGLMQTASAFGQVQSALSYIIAAYTDIAEMWSVVSRLEGFLDGMHKADALRAASGIETGTADGIAAEGLALDLPDGRPLLTVGHLHVPAGDSLLVNGASGTGKSTLFRVLAGLWPFGRGRIARPGGDAAMFLPQRPYLPVDSLRAALAYPAPAAGFGDEDYRAALAALGLEKLIPRLDEEANWAQVLSGGEQQRVQLARALLKKPAWLFLDEATASLDDASEAAALEALHRILPQTTLVSIGHRPALQAFHKSRLDLGQPAAAAAE